MEVANEMHRRQVLGVLASAGGLFALPLAGCGNSSDTPQTVVPVAKKAIEESKIGDPSKFLKPKGTSTKPR